MAQKPWVVPIPGTTQMAHMLENIGAAAIRFTPTELSEINASVAAVEDVPRGTACEDRSSQADFALAWHGIGAGDGN